MTSTRISKPVLPAVTLDQAKAHLRITADDDDAVLTSLVEAAIDFLERDTGMSLINQTWRFWFDEIIDDLMLPINRRPVVDVISLTAYDASGQATQVEADSYFLNTVTVPARLRLAADNDWRVAANGMDVDIRAGFGETGADVPNSLRQAVLCLVAHWYEFRSAFDAKDQPVSIPDAYTRLIKPWRRMGI